MNPSQKTKLLNTEKYLWLSLWLFLAIWSYFSYNNWISDSEFWPITLSGHLDQWKKQPAILMKPLFHFSLSWIYLFDLTSAMHLKVAKAFYTFLGFLSFNFLYLLLKKEIQSIKAFCVVLILLFSHLGFTQIGLIRSDFLSFFIFVFFLMLSKNMDDSSWKKNGGLCFVFSVLLYLTSPKSVFFVFLLLIHSFFKLKSESRFRFLLLFGWLSVIVFTFFDRFVLNGSGFQAFNSALVFAIHSYQSSQALPFFNLHLKGYLQNDVVIWLVFILGLFWQIREALKGINTQWTALGFSVLLVFFIHKPALPFFVGSYWGVLFLSLIPVYKKIELKYFVGTAALTLILFLLKFSFVFYYPNQIQLQTVTEIENLIKKIPGGKVFDGLGLLPKGPEHLLYLGPDDPESNSYVLEKIKRVRPELIVYTVRLDLIKDEVVPFLNDNYESIGIGYWIRKDLKAAENLNQLKPAFFVFGFYPVPEMLNY